MSLSIKDGNNTDKTLKTATDGADLVPYHVARTEYAASTSTIIKNYSDSFSVTSGSAKSLVVTNLTSKDLFILLGSGVVSSTNFSYVLPTSSSYEALQVNCQLQHQITGSTSAAGSYSVTVTI
jgi:hypothetical protein